MKKRKFSFIGACVLALTICGCSGVANRLEPNKLQAVESTTTYVFKSKSWTANVGSTASNWTSGQDGAGFSNNGIQVTTAASGANGTSPVSYSNVTKVVLTYNTNKSSGAGSFDVQVGSNDAENVEWAYSSGDGRSANYTATVNYSEPQTGNVKVIVNCDSNSCYLVSCAITTGAANELSSISVQTAPTKTVYIAGEMFDPSGLVITRTYSDDSSDTYAYNGHESDFTFSPSLTSELTTDDSSVEITCGGKTTNQSITVNPFVPATAISLNRESADIFMGGTVTLTATLIPSNSTSQFTWETSDATVATVENGVVTGVEEGTVTITAKVSDSIKAECTVNVNPVAEPAVNSISLSDFIDGENTKTVAYYVDCEIKAFKTGSTKDIYGNMTVTDGENDLVIYGATLTASALVWNRKNTYVFTNPRDFQSNSTSNALTIGTKITMKLIRCDFGSTIEGQGIITAIHASAIALNNSTANILVGNTITLTASLTPSISTSTYTWETSNEAIATVEDGVVTGVAAGTATITAKVSNSVKAECEINVTSTESPDVYLSATTSFATIHGTEHTVAHDGTDKIQFSLRNLSNNTQYPDPFNGDGGKFTVTFGGGSNDGKYYDTGSGIRTYGDGIITIASEYTITSITLTFSGNSYKPTSDSVVNVGEYDVETGVWTGSENEVVFTRPSGSGHWRLQKVDVSLVDSDQVYDSVDNVAIRFGATIPQSDWAGLKANLNFGINDYGVMLVKKNTLVNTYKCSTVEQAKLANETLMVLHTGNNNDPYELDENTYSFTVKLGGFTSDDYETVICAAPFILVGDEYCFFEQIEWSVKDLAKDYYDNYASRDCNLSKDALKDIAGIQGEQQ